MNTSIRMQPVRMAGGVVGAGLMALALPVNSGWGPFGSAAPKPADAAVSCNSTRVFQKGSANIRAAIVPVSSQGSRNCLLGAGNRGNSVRFLQTSLRFCNDSNTLATDASYGSKTKAAVVRAQRALGITQDGVYGPITGGQMQWLFVDSRGQKTCETLAGARAS